MHMLFKTSEHTLSSPRRDGAATKYVAPQASRPSRRDRAALILAQWCAVVIFCFVQTSVKVSADETAGPRGKPFHTHHVEWSPQGDAIEIKTTGGDPYLIWKWREPLEPDQFVVSFEYFCPREIDQVSAYLGPPLTEATRVELPNIPLAEGWQEFAAELKGVGEERLSPQIRVLRLDFGTRPDVRLRIRNLQIRARNSQELASAVDAEKKRRAKLETAQRIGNYLNQTFPIRFQQVIVNDESVVLTGSFNAESEDWERLKLVEFPPYLSIDDPGLVVDVPITLSGEEFSIQLPRVTEKRDRRFSGWRLATGADDALRYLSSRSYASKISTAKPDHAAQRPTPKTQKGLSGFSHRGPKEDLPQLGIDAITLNLVLNRFLTTSPGPRREQIDVDGPAAYFDHGAFDGFDPLVDFARQHQVVVSAIVLIPKSRQTHLQSPLVHPESNGGVYAMPDLTTPRGAKLYEVVLDRIAERYRHTDRAPGGITNWIVHNEIDFHPVWTNMGLQPRSICTETYYRSMRMIYNAARSYNPHARVFVSLTHHWDVPEDGKWRQLSPRETVETLQRYSQKEGEFAWGVAYHPYPQSLFAPVAWNDSQITDAFDTPLITIQNLHVLGAFLGQPEMLNANGRMRPVILSEQGFHTDSYEEEAQARQAGSLYYAMSRIRKMPWIESFHYHRWIDHPDEGGLMLGLRTLPTPKHRYGQRKRSWHIYQAIGTEQELQATRDLPRPDPR